MRLIDRLLFETFPMPDVMKSDQIQLALRDAYVIVADNIAEYWYLHRQRFIGDGTWNEVYPHLVPPFQVTWIEYRSPWFSNSEKGEMDDRTIGWLLISGTVDSAEQLSGRNLGITSADKPWRHVFALQFIENDYRLIGPVEHIEYVLDREGQLIAINGEALVPTVDTTTGEMSERGAGFDRRICKERLHILFLCLSFLHCKNVAQVENAQSFKLQRARMRRGKPPLVTYRTLEINPMKEILRTEGRSEEVGLKRALHICRGHFASYTEDKKLFGRITGRFWIPAHVRGSKEVGEVKKDYKIKLASQGGHS